MNWDKIKNLDVNDLRDLDINNIGSWPAPARIAVLVLIFAAIIGGGYWYFIKDKLTELESLEKKEVTLKQEFSTKQAKAANLEAYKAQLEEMRRSFGAMLRQLPGQTEVDDLLVDISQTALASGLEQQLFKPAGENPKDFYAELPVQMRYTGSYHEFGSFASGIAALPRIVTLHDISIKPLNDTNGDSLVMEVTAKTYRYLEVGEQSKSGGGK
ncbi:MAG TPA: type 4a pilus biogenesis protein PilO [Gammaproteobacteria bacterium]|nr:type 4a pilus biogenesis protein PilO [Gammaproteobacteria bacterium]